MGMLDFLTGKKDAPPGTPRNSRTGPNSTQFVASQLASGSGSVHSVRKDLLKLVLREMLSRNGIPQPWLSADMLRTNSPKREQGIHVRCLVRVWEPRLMLHGPALETFLTELRYALLQLAVGGAPGFADIPDTATSLSDCTPASALADAAGLTYEWDMDDRGIVLTPLRRGGWRGSPLP